MICTVYIYDMIFLPRRKWVRKWEKERGVKKKGNRKFFHYAVLLNMEKERAGTGLNLWQALMDDRNEESGSRVVEGVWDKELGIEYGKKVCLCVIYQRHQNNDNNNSDNSNTKWSLNWWLKGKKEWEGVTAVSVSIPKKPPRLSSYSGQGCQ